MQVVNQDVHGFFRGEKLQELIDDESTSEFKTYNEWYNWAKTFVSVVPEADTKIKIMDAMPKDVYEDIFKDGMYYWVKKFKYNSPSKFNSSQLIDEIKLNMLPDVYTKLMEIKDGESITLSDFNIPHKEFTYRPTLENDSDSFYNSFQPGFIATMKRDLSIKEIPSEFDKLLDNLADEKAKKWLINHMSTWINLFLNDFQYKGDFVRLETIPIFYGNQGTGKNTIMKYFSQAIEKTGYVEVSKGMFSSQFNSWLLNSVILMNEFSENKENRKASSAAIKLLTSSSATINEKGVREYKIDNVAYIAFACNTSDYSAFDIESTDRRLQFISGGKNLNARNHHVCNMELLEQQKEDFINFLINYDYDFEAANTVYDDDIKTLEKEASKSNMEFYVDKIIAEENPYILTVKYVQKIALKDDIKISSRPLGIYMSKKFGKRIQRKISGFVHSYYEVREKNDQDQDINSQLWNQEN